MLVGEHREGGSSVRQRLTYRPTPPIRPGDPLRQPGSGTQLFGIQAGRSKPSSKLTPGLRSELGQVGLHASDEVVNVLQR